MKIKVVMDSGGLMNKQEANQLGIDYLPLQVMINDQTYMDGVDLDRNFLYDQMEKGAKVQTSLPPLGLVDELFQEYKNTGITDVVLITLSNALSSTNEKVQIMGQEHGLHMHTLDIYSTLGMEKYMAIYAKRMVDEGLDPETIIARLKESVDRSCGYLIVEDLDHLAKGGRLTPMAAKLGGMLKIKPILRVSKDTKGRVDIYDKVRTMKRAIKQTCEIISQDPQLNAKDYQIVIMDSRARGYAQYAQDMLELLVPGIEIERDDLCPVINCHTGMGSIGIQYIYRR
ncbi:MAG: DegV family protein [Absicoccus porci]|uniref:DegV family protein n=1 Tax=Absicoccus porci TaxID=2486576 RepID=UPI0023552E96|nr:DegV family protein [Absicoccus porci]MCI6087534.1 DegV family protein [Absicoccus porci]MDD7330629.1 DegV family protein [Absicoccus porci]MDY4738523.1 DegV family protein [Absicoccus porci]